MYNLIKCENFLINFIAENSDVTAANSLKIVFSSLLAAEDAELTPFITAIDTLFPPVDNNIRDNPKLVADILKALGIPQNPSTEQKQLIKAHLKKLLRSFTEKILHINKIKSSLTADIKKTFADYREKNGLIKFIKFINGDNKRIITYLLEHLPTTHAKQDLIAQLSDLSFLRSVISDSIGEQIMGKTINYSAEELAKLTEKVNADLAKNFTNDKAEEGLADFFRDNLLTAHDPKLITEGQSYEQIKQSIFEYAQDPVIAESIIARGGQAHDSTITPEIISRMRFRGEQCAFTTEKEQYYLEDIETGKKYILFKHNVYALSYQSVFYVLGHDRKLELFKPEEEMQLSALVKAGLPPREPIVQVCMAVDIYRKNAEADHAEFKISEFKVKINTKDIVYNYHSTSKPNLVHQPRPAPATLTYKPKALANLSQYITEYANNLMVTDSGASIKDFARHDYIKDKKFSTCTQDNETIISTVKSFAGNNEIIANAMLSCGGQTLQACILAEQLNHRYLYNGVPIGISTGVKTEITYTKSEHKVSADIVFDIYVIVIVGKFYGLSINGDLEELDQQEVSDLNTNIQKNKPITRQPLLFGRFNLDIEEHEQKALYTAKHFRTELKINDPAITLRSARLSQDYERLRFEIARLNNDLSALQNQQSEEFIPKEQKINEIKQKISQAKQQQLEIDRTNFNSLFYYSDLQKDHHQMDFSWLSNLQLNQQKHKEEALKLKKIQLKDQIKALEDKRTLKRNALLDPNNPDLLKSRQELQDILVKDVLPDFNTAFTLIMHPEEILKKRLTENFNSLALNNLIHNIQKSILVGDSVHINLLEKKSFEQFILNIDNCLSLIEKALNDNKTSRIERAAHSIIKAIDNQSGYLLGERHNKIQLSKNLKRYSKQLISLKEQLQQSDYYRYKISNGPIENLNYKSLEAQLKKSAIKRAVEKNKGVIETNEELERANTQLNAVETELRQRSEKVNAKISELDKMMSAVKVKNLV